MTCFHLGPGPVKGLAPPDIGIAVEVAVIGFVDAGNLLARLAHHRGDFLAVGGHEITEIGLDHIRKVRLLRRVEAGDQRADRVPFETHFRQALCASGAVLALFDRGEGRIDQDVQKPAAC